MTDHPLIHSALFGAGLCNLLVHISVQCIWHYFCLELKGEFAHDGTPSSSQELAFGYILMEWAVESFEGVSVWSLKRNPGNTVTELVFLFLLLAGVRQCTGQANDSMYWTCTRPQCFCIGMLSPDHRQCNQISAPFFHVWCYGRLFNEGNVVLLWMWNRANLGDNCCIVNGGWLLLIHTSCMLHRRKQI